MVLIMRTFNTSKNTKLLIATTVTAGLFLAGCGGDDPEQTPAPDSPETTVSPDNETQDTTSPETEASETATHSAEIDETSTEPVGSFSTELYESENWPAIGDTEGIYPVEVRSAEHDGFERIVIEHAGSGAPSYMAQYTDDPVEPGRGQPIDTGDGAYLEVIASGTASFDEFDEDEMLENGQEITDLDTEAVGTVVSFAPWEATSNYIIGLDEQRPYAITMLDDPVRIVVDIQLDDNE